MLFAQAAAARRAQEPVVAQSTGGPFGGAYSGLDSRRQRLVDDWVARFNEVTAQNVEAGLFYDTFVRFSTKTTFDAVTNALMKTPLTDASRERLGDALDLVERVESDRGQVEDASGDRQFRIYAKLKEGALDALERSQEFRRGPDNTVYHKGYPINFRQQGGIPSIQISVAPDGRRPSTSTHRTEGTTPWLSSGARKAGTGRSSPGAPTPSRTTFRRSRPRPKSRSPGSKPTRPSSTPPGISWKAG
jgi:hypothetical protein